MFMMPLVGILGEQDAAEIPRRVRHAHRSSIAMWHLSTFEAQRLVPAGSCGPASTRRSGLAFLFVPITTASLRRRRRRTRANKASALINLMRNLGGSFGISHRQYRGRAPCAVSSRAARRGGQSPLPELPARIAAGAAVLPSAWGERRARARGRLGWIAKTVGSQSVLLAYMDVFWVASIFALCMVPLVLLLLKRIDLKASRAPVH